MCLSRHVAVLAMNKRQISDSRRLDEHFPAVCDQNNCCLDNQPTAIGDARIVLDDVTACDYDNLGLDAVTLVCIEVIKAAHHP